MNRKKVYLTLQNGKTLQGYAFGAEGEITGELVFSTGMVGYIETLTDPSNLGKIIVQTFPLIGNYGMIYEDMESDRAWASAYVVREICDTPSNFRMDGDLESFLKEQNVIGVYGVDTRELTKILREEGVMRARISERPLKEAQLAELASSEEKEVCVIDGLKMGFFAAENATYKVALWNFGCKNSDIVRLTEQGYDVISMPASTTAEDILALEVDGIVLSDGPGDPIAYASQIEEVKKVLGVKPVFGMGLGHQLVAIAFGAKTAKHKYGHRGSNQPVKCLDCGKVYISTQNHGYEVLSDSVKTGKISFVNVNDNSCEGIFYEEQKAMTVQFNPAACSIGDPVNPLYEKFRAMMEKEKENA